MPLYEYKCERCNTVFELIQKFSDSPLSVHEGCGGAVERLISSPALQFKGTGWYITDYARGNGGSKEHNGSGEKKNGTAESKPKSEPAASAPAKSETK